MKSNFIGKLRKNLTARLLFTLFIYTVVGFGLVTLSKYFYNLRAWMGKDFIYRLAYLIDYNIEIFMVLYLLIGYVVIVLRHMRKPISYIEDIYNAIALIYDDSDEMIVLPEQLKEMELMMNHTKVTIRNNEKVARDSVQKKNDLIVYLAHDIKTPLTSMIGYLSLLDEVDDMPKAQGRKYIDIALKKSYKLEELINELFDIARFSEQEIYLELNDINLNMMLEQIAEDFYPTLKELNKEIKILSTDNITLEGDLDKLARVFNNVIKNALVYSYDNSIVTIEVRKEDNFAIVEIINEGRKISKEKLKKIFEKFYRIDNSRTSTGGSGLGLAIAKEIVLAHKGTIEAISDDKYTKFTIAIPIIN